MNNVVLIDRLTRDPELKYIPQSETAVANFTLAVDRPMAKEKTADFIRIVAFGKTAELCERFARKGKRIGLQGRIQTGSYKNKDGQTVYTTDVICERLEIIDWPDKESQYTPDGFTEVPDARVEYARGGYQALRVLQVGKGGKINDQKKENI